MTTHAIVMEAEEEAVMVVLALAPLQHHRLPAYRTQTLDRTLLGCFTRWASARLESDMKTSTHPHRTCHPHTLTRGLTTSRPQIMGA